MIATNYVSSAAVQEAFFHPAEVQMLSKFPKAFASTKSTTTIAGIFHEIHTRPSRPVAIAQHRRSLKEIQIRRERVNAMLQDNVIQHSKS